MDRSGHEDAHPSTGATEPRVDTSSPNVARMYDYYLGGAANFAVDREAAERALAITPEIGRFARMNREFLGRVVRYLCERDIDQFLDLGSGVPTVGNVHEIAHQHNPDARVAYVDHESVAIAHARALLAEEPYVSATQADIRRPAEVLSAPGVAGLLDFSRPVAVLAVAIMHFVPDADDPVGILRAYRAACAPGSYLALSHAATITMTESESQRGQGVYRSTTTPLVLRDRDEIAALFDGCDLVEPGLTPINHWPSQTEESPANGYGAVAELR
ncbi:S-adenosyl methyltransferase [Saccharopolyspora kobensis]|uniref:S-adenosyl methyltransferase n=1 Tax=Saccharopolyspora kobensis TaxID=146035 RepID=A0A1H6A248_9PSEU|nr:SAM-dependent methyltransferase [Saccharopolyspora kobensis]SEG42125.1 S-adenosyl methyltransferase [Saccharopolyspora kobensis]SFE17397.1 S-adenosyl methyltransferase [Saccharopolyspora kobensis]